MWGRCARRARRGRQGRAVCSIRHTDWRVTPRIRDVEGWRPGTSEDTSRIDAAPAAAADAHRRAGAEDADVSVDGKISSVTLSLSLRLLARTYGHFEGPRTVRIPRPDATRWTDASDPRRRRVLIGDTPVDPKRDFYQTAPPGQRIKSHQTQIVCPPFPLPPETLTDPMSESSNGNPSSHTDMRSSHSSDAARGASPPRAASKPVTTAASFPSESGSAPGTHARGRRRLRGEWRRWRDGRR
eukprot:787574-Prymnesium_polylepis.1